MKTFALFLGVAMALAASCTPAEMAAVTRVDPKADPKFCPLQCPRGCCEEGSADDGYFCVNPEDTGPDVCQWSAISTDQSDPVFGKKRGVGDAGLVRDAGL